MCIARIPFGATRFRDSVSESSVFNLVRRAALTAGFRSTAVGYCKRRQGRYSAPHHGLRRPMESPPACADRSVAVLHLAAQTGANAALGDGSLVHPRRKRDRPCSRLHLLVLVPTAARGNQDLCLFGWIAEIYARNFVLPSIVAGGLHIYFYIWKRQGNRLKFDARSEGARPQFHLQQPSRRQHVLVAWQRRHLLDGL